MTEPKQPLYIEVNGKIVLPDPLRPGHFVNATPEAAAAIAALEAEVARKDAAIRRALAEAVADDMDGWYAGLRAGLADKPAEGGK